MEPPSQYTLQMEPTRPFTHSTVRYEHLIKCVCVV